MANVGFTGGKADPPSNLIKLPGEGASDLSLETVNMGTGKHQPNVGERRGPGGTGSSGTASSSR